MAATTTERLPAWASDPEQDACGIISHLYGPNGGQHAVFGSYVAVGKLKSAIDEEGMSVRRGWTTTLSGLPADAYRHLQAAGKFPSGREVQVALEMFKTECMDREMGALLYSERISRVQACGSPPFLDLIAQKALQSLIAVQLHCDQSSIHILDEIPHQYQLGIVSAIWANGIVTRHAQLFRIYANTAATTTVWLLRECIFNDYGTDYVEQWHSIDLSAAQVDTPQQATTTNPPLASNKVAASKVNEPRYIGDDDTSLVTESETATQYRHAPVDLSSLSPEKILNSNRDFVIYENILRVAEHYGNTEILEAFNQTLRNRGRAEFKNDSSIASRLKVARDCVAPLRGMTSEELHAQLNEARKANGVMERMRKRMVTRKDKQQTSAKKQDRDEEPRTSSPLEKEAFDNL